MSCLYRFTREKESEYSWKLFPWKSIAFASWFNRSHYLDAMILGKINLAKQKAQVIWAERHDRLQFVLFSLKNINLLVFSFPCAKGRCVKEQDSLKGNLRMSWYSQHCACAIANAILRNGRLNFLEFSSPGFLHASGKWRTDVTSRRSEQAREKEWRIARRQQYRTCFWRNGGKKEKVERTLWLWITIH